MKHNELTKELLSITPKSFKYLHEQVGMDLEKDFMIAKGTGKLTPSVIEKSLNTDFSTCYKIVIFLKSNRTFDTEPYVVLLESGSIKNEGRGISSSCYRYGLDSFVMKKSMEEVRKGHVEYWFAVAQKSEYLNLKKEEPIDLRSRYKVTKTHSTCVQTRFSVSHYVSSANAINEYGRPAELHFLKSKDENDINYHVDKSGYLIDCYKASIAFRLFDYKKDKRKREVSSIDYSKDITLAENKFEIAKEKLIKEIRESKPGCNINSITRKFVHFSSDVNRLREYAESGKFNSVEEYKSMLDSIDEDFVEIINM